MPTFIFVLEPKTDYPIAVVDTLGFQAGFVLGAQFYILPEKKQWREKIGQLQGFAYSHPTLDFSFAKGMLMQVRHDLGFTSMDALKFLISMLAMKPWELIGKPKQEGHFSFPKAEYAEYLRHRFIKQGIDPEIKPIVQPTEIKELTDDEVGGLIYGTTEETNMVPNYELTPTRPAMLGLGVDVPLNEPYEGALISKVEALNDD